MATAAILSESIPQPAAMTDDDDNYFNNLSQKPNQAQADSSPPADEIPKAKRIACVLCRKRKLKCDGTKPSCGTCKRLSHDCSYDEVRKKSGPKRGYVRQLEARLAQVETLLKTSDPPAAGFVGADRQSFATTDVDTSETAASSFPTQIPNARRPSSSVPYEVMDLDLEEPLPTQDIVDDLNATYFQKVHPVAPLIHPGRYFAAMALDPHHRPPICLRYAMWASAASVVDRYEDLQEHFYRRARKYIERDEMRAHGEAIVTIQHVQTWYLLAMIEFKMTFFPRAWMSTGRACRLAVMMGLHRLDFAGLEVKQCLPPPRDWTDKEERRRTFWQCFCADRFASIGTGWPTTIDESDIRTNLPADEDAFEQSRETPTISLQQALETDAGANLSATAGVMIMACLFGRNLVHLHRSAPEDNEKNLNGKFWSRHRVLDHLLLKIALSMPDHLRLPSGTNDHNVIFLNLCIHTSVICLHQAAIFKADANKLPANISAESKIRCITAAAEIASIMRIISHVDLTNANPFATFCLYVAARVFVQYLKSRPSDGNVKASLQFLLTAMQAMRRKNLLTESLLVQLDIDLQAAGLEEARSLRNRLSKMGNTTATPAPGCRLADPMPDMHTPMPSAPIPKRRTGHAFGDNTLSYLAQSASRPVNSRVSSVSEGPSPPANGQGVDFSRVRFMPSRTKTSSTRPSPATVSDECMDFSRESMESASPGSLNCLSSHTSSVSQQTPPLLNNDTQSSSWVNDKPLFAVGPDSRANTDFNASAIPMSDEDFRNMMELYGDTMNPPDLSSTDPVNTVMGGTSEETAFTMPNASFSSGTNATDNPGFADSASTNGGDLLAMSEEEWKQVIDSGMLDMGWNGTFLSDHGSTDGASWTPGVR